MTASMGPAITMEAGDARVNNGENCEYNDADRG